MVLILSKHFSLCLKTKMLSFDQEEKPIFKRVKSVDEAFSMIFQSAVKTISSDLKQFFFFLLYLLWSLVKNISSFYLTNLFYNFYHFLYDENFVQVHVYYIVLTTIFRSLYRLHFLLRFVRNFAHVPVVPLVKMCIIMNFFLLSSFVSLDVENSQQK